MRINDEERIIIRNVLHKYFGDKAHIILFGSRIDDQARGGDIDVLVDTDQVQDVFKRKLQALTDLQIALGDQKIDLLIKDPNMCAPEPIIFTEALATGVEL